MPKLRKVGDEVSTGNWWTSLPSSYTPRWAGGNPREVHSLQLSGNNLETQMGDMLSMLLNVKTPSRS